MTARNCQLYRFATTGSALYFAISLGVLALKPRHSAISVFEGFLSTEPPVQITTGTSSRTCETDPIAPAQCGHGRG
jgi:hypothetical protein